MSDVNVVLYPVVYQNFISWQGPIGRHMNARLVQLEQKARNRVGVYTEPPVRTMGTSVSGALLQSIRVERTYSATGALEARVGADAQRPEDFGSYALYHHEPTGSHPGGGGPYEIFPFEDRKNPMLRFYWKKKGKVVSLPYVRNHPGSAGRYYLTGPQNLFLKEFVS